MKWVFTSPILALVIPACGGSGHAGTGGDAGTDDAGVCSTAPGQAIAQVQSAVDANLTCSTDADCAIVAFAASCFDACSRVVNEAGVAAVSAAIDKVNAGACAQFVREGCQLIRPPCVPPPDAKCTAGMCM